MAVRHSAIFLAVVCLSLAKGRWLGEGTLQNLQEVFIGRCHNYIQVVNPSVGKRNCTDIWEAFLSAFAYKNPCSVPPASYMSFIDLVRHPIPPDKALFWEKNKDLVGRFSESTRRMMPLQDTLIAWMLHDVSWCGGAAGDGLDYTSCPTTVECEYNPVESFFKVASETYANLSLGVISVMLNGSASDGTFPEKSFFAEFELPFLRQDQVTEVQIWVMDDLDGPDVESCGTKSVAVLEEILTEKGFKYTCTDNYRAVRMLQCTDAPSHPECLCSSTASTVHLCSCLLLFAVFILQLN